MAEAAVVNASPLIYLTEVARLELLRLAGDEILVPRAVADEVRRWGDDDTAVRALGATPWLKIVETPAVPASVEAGNLGAGEAAVLSYALAHPGMQATMDDLAGRRCAVVHHVDGRGCLGLVLVAKQRRVIPLARPLVEALRESGLYLSDGVIRRALAWWANEQQRIARRSCSSRSAPPDLALSDHHSLCSRRLLAAEASAGSGRVSISSATRFMASVTAAGSWRATYSSIASARTQRVPEPARDAGDLPRERLRQR